jgi:SAM-dependent methyltransferase
VVVHSATRSGEANWWERHSDFATRQWELTPALNQIVRREYLAEMRDWLFRPGGRLLEVGCGSGWAGIEVARHGMSLTGIDPSKKQLTLAQRQATQAGLRDVRFLCTTIETAPLAGKFDAILVHAVLHHLDVDEIHPLLSRVRELLAHDGALYIYEPLTTQSGARGSPGVRATAAAISVALWWPWALTHWVGIHLRIGPKAFREAVKAGWSGLSPDERPLDAAWLSAVLSEEFIVPPPRFWHAFSLALAMGCTELPPALAAAADVVVAGLYAADQRLLRSRFQPYLAGPWMFAGIKARPRHADAEG